MLNVLVVDDSAVARWLIGHIVGSQPDMRVVGEAHNGAEALALVRTLDPDVVTMDIRMPIMDGYEATATIMSTTPKPIVMVSAHEPAEIARSFRAIDAGATMVLRKPVGLGDPSAEQIAGELADAIRSVAGLKLVTRRRRTAPADPVERTPYTPSAERSPAPAPAVARPAPAARPVSPSIDLIAIAASTGGPAAVASILRALPADLSVPILLVQHIADGFDAGFATYLNSVTPLTVRLARSGEIPEPGVVLVGPNGHHLTIVPGGRVRLSNEEPVGGHRPSATPLFSSVARVHGAGALGIILTGIGRDGCDGLVDLHRAGGRIISQDEETSVVWGMPRAAVEAGVADQVLAIEDVAAAIVSACRRGRAAA